MSEGEGYDEGSAEGQEAASRQIRRARELRSQAEMAWTRVQQVMRQRTEPGISPQQLLDAIDKIPTESYLAGISAALITSAWIHAMGHRTTASIVGIGTPLLMGAGLYLKITRRRQPRV